VVAETWFQGIRPISIAIPQVSVIPAKTRPQPTNPARPAPMLRHSSSGPKAASAAPIATSAPAAIRTCRSSDIAFRPRTTGRPAASQAVVPPSTLTTSPMPAATIRSQAVLLRPPERQTK